MTQKSTLTEDQKAFISQIVNRVQGPFTDSTDEEIAIEAMRLYHPGRYVVEVALKPAEWRRGIPMPYGRERKLAGTVAIVELFNDRGVLRVKSITR